MLVKEKLQKNWRFIIPMLALLLGLALSAGGAFAGVPATSPLKPAAEPQVKTAPFNCARMKEMGIEKQMNFHASEILAACSGMKFQLPNDAPTNADLSVIAKSGNGKSVNPNDYGGTDRNASSSAGDGAYPKVTQSESMVWGHGNTVVVNYNDSRTSPACYAGYSFSTDGGTTWTRPGGAAGASPLCTGHGTNYGDPIVVWNDHLSAWFIGDLATGCGGQGIGMWTSPDGQTFTPSACAHSGTSDDRQSMWVDNAPTSPFYGRMYVSWNNFAAGQNIYVVYSDNGTTWSTPVQVQTGGFIRNVQDTGSPNGDGAVFIAGMNESGGGLSSRTNIMYRSTNGGAAWTAITMGSPFPGPGDALCDNPYFAKISPIWRHMGWGQPAVGPQIGGQNVVHYVYAAHGSGADTGDIMYTRSVDNGSTWSTPVRLNTDTGTRVQWMPSLAVTNGGSVMASWYDRRDTTNNDYKWYGNMSRDNGATWQGDMPVSDVVITQPLQPDTAVQACYAGDYNYHSADGQNLYMTWTDGRVLINGNPQQDVFFDKAVGGPTYTPTNTPLCGANCTSTPTVTLTRTSTPTATVCGVYVAGAAVAATIVPGTTDTGNHGDDVATSINFPFPVQFYNNLSYTGASVISNGNLQFETANTAFTNECLPSATMGPSIMPFWDDLRTDTMGSCTPGPCGIYTSVTGNPGSRVFNIEWRAFYFSGSGSANFEIRLFEGQPDYEFIWGNITGATTSATIGVQDGSTTQPRYTELVCNAEASQYMNKRVPMMFNGCGGSTRTPTRTLTPCPSCTATPLATNTPTATCATGYGYTTATATIVPGTDDSGNHGDDVVTSVNLPFAFSLYGTPYNSANISSNGNLQFTTQSTLYTNTCLPAVVLGPSIIPFWEDLNTSSTGSCTPGPCGVYTSISGSQPNRIFNIEWRAYYFPSGCCANFEIRLYEAAPSHFDVIIGTITGTNDGATIGVQDGAGGFTQYICNTTVPNNTKIAFMQGSCGTPGTATRTNTPGQNTATRTPTQGGNTVTRTRTSMPTNTPGRTMTPRPSVTPCGDCAIEMLAVVTSCYLDGTVHWIAIAHNPDRCMVQAPWRAELQVRNNGGNFRTVRIQYATSNFMPGDTVWDGYFCYHFSSNVRDMRVEVLYEDQAGRIVSPGSNDKVQERGAPANMYSTTPDSGRPVAKNNGDSPTQCNGDMASQPMAPCQSNDGCSPPPSPIPTGVSTRAPILPIK